MIQVHGVDERGNTVLRKQLKRDRARTKMLRMSRFGIIEMTRQRVRPNLLHTHSEPCPTCGGTGRVMGPDTTVTKIERWLQRYEGILLVISHDRDFLDQVCTRIAHIENCTINLFTGNYSQFDAVLSGSMP